MKIVKGEHLEQLRKQAGLSRRALSEKVGIHETHIAKMERGEVQSTSAENIRKLARALKVSVEEISESPPVPPIRVWAERHGVTPKRAATLARAGQIEGAYKGPWPGFYEDVWIVEPDAERLPPTEEQRAQWREHWRRYNKTEYNRERRKRMKEEGS